MSEKIAENIKFPAAIKEKIDYFVNLQSSGLYSISISARVKSAKQINSSDDEDLQIEIDGRKFSKIPNEGKLRYKNIAPAFNGNDLKGLKKTVVFFIWLAKGTHTISLIPDNSARVEDVVIEKIEDIKKIDLEINEQAEDGDRRSWFTFVFAELSVKEISVSIIAQSRWFDRDDAQIKIDGEIQSYKNADILHRFWYWIGSLLKGKEEVAYFKPNLSEGTHYIEINADRMPLLKNVSFFIGDIFFKGIISDTNHGITEVKFRDAPKRADNNTICEILVGKQIDIIEEVVSGEYITNMSDIWHKILYGGKEGYVISTYIDIEGKTQKIIKDKIIQESGKLKMDENLMLAIAKAESHFKPYAVSEVGAKGIFQLTPIAIEQLSKKDMGDLYFELADPFNIKQNIQGGIRYFKWLYSVYYKGDADAIKKSLAGYNWGIGYVPRNIPFNQIEIPVRVKQYIEDILKYEEEFRQGGFGILKSIISVFLMFIASVIIATMLQSANCNSAVGQMGNVPDLNNNGGNFIEIIENNNNFLSPRVYLNYNKIVFVNSNNKIAGYLDKDKLFDIQDYGNNVYLRGDVIEYPNNVFYFFASESEACGSGGCGYNFYKYKVLADELEVIDEGSIFGSAPKIFLSPDSKLAAVLSHSNAGIACAGAYISVFNLDEGKNWTITGFESGNFQESRIEKVGWKSDTETEFTTENYNCGAFRAGHWIKYYAYDTLKESLTLTREEFVPASETGG